MTKKARGKILNPPPHFGHQGAKAQRNAKNIIFVPLSGFVPWWQRKSQKDFH